MKDLGDEFMSILQVFGLGPDDLSVLELLRLRHAVRSEWAVLTPREREILNARVGFSWGSKNAAAVAKHFGITVQDVREIERKARRLRLQHDRLGSQGS